MENPISYSDLFSPDIQQGIEGLVSDITRVEKQLKGMLGSVKSEAQALGEALASVSSATKGGRDTTKTDSAQADKLYESYTQLSKMYEENQKTLRALLDTEKAQNERLAKAKTATDEYASALDRLKAQADLAKDALAKVGTSGNSAEIKQLQSVVKGLEEQVKNLTKAQNANASATNSAGKSHSKQKAELLSLANAYASLSPIVEKTGVDLNALITTEKQHQQVSKNGQVANTALAGSYNQLYAQYNLLKTALNAMSTEMRNNTAVGKEWEAEALRIMNEMKAMQEATGKSTLSVGDYGKALNGLNIATQQVLREMPTLANSVQQFFIAISNNVPIFVDNFKRAQTELGGFTKAVGATLKAVLSWQTVLLVILTILPKIAKAIHDKKKAQEEANKETEKALTLEEMLAKSYLEVSKYEAQEVTKLQFLVKVTQDYNRSMNDRVMAARVLRQEYRETLGLYSEEQIVAGEAKGAIDRLTESVREHALARAMMNEMVKYYQQILENQAKIDEAQLAYDNAKAAREAAEATEARIMSMSNLGEAYGKYAEQTEKARRKEAKALETLNMALGETDKAMAAIADLEKKIPINGLLETITKGGRGAKDSILEIPSYYNDALKAIIDGMEDGIQKQLALLDYDFKVEREKRMEQQAALEDMLAKHNTKELQLTKEQVAAIKAELSNLALAMVAEEQNYLDARQRMLQVTLKPVEVEEESDWDEENAKWIGSQIEVERKWLDKKARMEYANDLLVLKNREHSLQDEIDLKNKLNGQLLANEKSYWEEFLRQLEEEGLQLTDTYQKVVEKVASLTGKESNSQRRGRRKRGGVRNLVELGFALNHKTGEKDSETGMFRVKEEYQDFANAVNEALQRSMDYMDEWMDKRIEMAEVAVEAAQKETESAKTALDYEMQARANGYANNVELARKEYEEKLQMERQAIAERKRLEKIQEGINTAQQIGALVTATANLWSGYSSIPIAGPALAIAATALMWSSFFAAKIQAAQLANTETHGHGMAEYIDYGGSHASHNDVDFGHTKDGRRRRIERGEVVGVVRKDKVQKYGIERVMNIINNLNNGTFEKNYVSSTEKVQKYGIERVMNTINNLDNGTFEKNYVSSTELVNSVIGENPGNKANSAFLSAKVEDMLRSVGSRSMGLKTGNTGIFDTGRLEANYEMAFNGASTDLSGVERGIETLIEQNKVRVVSTPWGRIEYKGNNKRIIRNG
jgi:hypothetical protein|nr:MAG TPA: tail length tape measure protein [Caudoviricetes sp.]